MGENIRGSVPLARRCRFCRCVQMPTAQSTKHTCQTDDGASRNAVIAADNRKHRDPAETRFQIRIMATSVTAPASPPHGQIAKMMPIDMAIPLPPLNPWNTGKRFPRINESAMNGQNVSMGSMAQPRITSQPRAISSSSAEMATFLFPRRSKFVNPGLPDPASRRFRFKNSAAAMSEKLMAPMR